MSDRNAFDRQLEREIDNLAGPEPRVDARRIVEGATAPRHRGWSPFGWPSLGLLGGGVAAVLALVLVMGIFGGDRSAIVDPGTTPSPEPMPSATPLAGAATPVSGTWSLPEPPECREQMPALEEGWIETLMACEGLRFAADEDQRLTGVGTVRHETWEDAQAPEVWRVTNDGGSWESQRFHDHDRFVFRGSGGYDGLTAVLTLAADGSLSGFVRAGEPQQDDE